MQSRVNGVPCCEGFQGSELLKYLQVIGIDCHSVVQHSMTQHSVAESGVERHDTVRHSVV
jgi:hypothetical protein